MMSQVRKENFHRKIKWLNYLLLSMLIAGNFAAMPSIKYLHVLYALFVLGSILLGDFKTIIPVLISYSFMEGQARILWDYHPAARIAFDSLIVFATLRSFVVSRDIVIRHVLPLPFLMLICFHFCWYVVEIFNLNSINFFAAIAGTKVYIFPFFLLVYFRKNEDAFDEHTLQEIGNLLIFLLICECSLGLFQLEYKEGFMLKIAPYYRRAMSGDIFTGFAFRPFGTTQLPGAISVFIFLTTGFALLRKEISKSFLLVLPLLTSLFVVTLIVCQVRSAALKFGVVFLGSWLAVFYNSPRKLTLAFRIFFGSLVIIPVMMFFFYPTIEKFVTTNFDLGAGLDRWTGIETVKDVASQRTSLSKSFEVAADKLKEFPMGVGPAMTGAAGGLSIDLMKSDPIFTKTTFWGYDNFFLSLIIEFGYGCIFYLSYILLVPIYLLSYFLKLLRKKDYDRSRILAICLIHVGVILIGNWGAIGISYNPESFYFWLWTAVAFNIYGQSLKSTPIKEEAHAAV